MKYLQILTQKKFTMQFLKAQGALIAKGNEDKKRMRKIRQNQAKGFVQNQRICRYPWFSELSKKRILPTLNHYRTCIFTFARFILNTNWEDGMGGAPGGPGPLKADFFN